MRLLALLLLFLAVLPVRAAEPDRRIAVTIDDLPWQWPDRIGDAALAERHGRLVAALRASGVRGVGFVNEGKLEVDGNVRPERVAMLRDWLDSGWELGNHTRGHSDLHAVGLAAYQDDILRGEIRLRVLLGERGQAPR